MKKPSFLRKELTCCLDRVWTFSLPSSIWRYSCYLLSSESTSWTREAHRFFFLLLCVQVRQQRQSGPRQALGLQLCHGSGKRQLWQGDACSSACQKKQPAGGKIFSHLLLISKGHACREEGHGRVVRHQNPEEGRGDPGRRRGVHHGGETSVGSVWKTSLPHAAALLFPNNG